MSMLPLLVTEKFSLCLTSNYFFLKGMENNWLACDANLRGPKAFVSPLCLLSCSRSPISC